MTYKIEDIEGIGPAYGSKLVAAGITTTDELLEKCSTPRGREELAEKTGMSKSVLLKWANMADLMRVSGVAKQYAELLEAAGVDTIKELRNRNFENLAEKMKEINDEKNLAKTSPAPSVVEGWIEQAKTLDPKITY
jgi:predicted flap endonuclease-1-like 5' DNA nuclease